MFCPPFVAEGCPGIPTCQATRGPLKDSLSMADVRKALQALLPDMDDREWRHVEAVINLDAAGELSQADLRSHLKAGNEAWQAVREPDPFFEDIEDAVGLRALMDHIRAALDGPGGNKRSGPARFEIPLTPPSMSLPLGLRDSGISLALTTTCSNGLPPDQPRGTLRRSPRAGRPTGGQPRTRAREARSSSSRGAWQGSCSGSSPGF